jgi:hypothetical protein
MPGSAEPASGVCSACGEAGGATDSFCEACGTGLAPVALAQQSGNENAAKLVAKVVDVVDAASGTAELKKPDNVEDHETARDTRSTKTARARSSWHIRTRHIQ